MVKWLFVLAVVAGVTWWVTRPASGAREQRKNIKMQQCPRCGVYVEHGQNCACGEGGGGNKGNKSKEGKK